MKGYQHMNGYQYAIIGLLGAMLAVSAGDTRAGVLFTGPGVNTLRDDATATVGTQFTATNTISVTHLGFYDDDFDGNVVTHQVGLWLDDGTLLGSVTVQSGTASSLTGQFRYEPLSLPITLTSGTTYRLGSEVFASSGDRWVDQVPPPGVGAPATIDNAAYETTTSFGFPVNVVGAGTSYYGPNFIFTEVVPEPSTMLLLGVGGLVWWRRNRK